VLGPPELLVAQNTDPPLEFAARRTLADYKQEALFRAVFECEFEIIGETASSRIVRFYYE
jgi:hypothetical protein